jgi:hypothetical protein
VRGPTARRKSLQIDAPAEALQAWLGTLGLEI